VNVPLAFTAANSPANLSFAATKARPSLQKRMLHWAQVLHFVLERVFFGLTVCATAFFV
jgi:hypothetical protein